MVRGEVESPAIVIHRRIFDSPPQNINFPRLRFHILCHFCCRQNLGRWQNRRILKIVNVNTNLNSFSHRF